MDTQWVIDKILPAVIAAILILPLSAILSGFFTFHFIKNRLEKKLERDKALWQLEISYSFEQTTKAIGMFAELLTPYRNQINEYHVYEAAKLAENWKELIEATKSFGPKLSVYNFHGVEQDINGTMNQLAYLLFEIGRDIMPYCISERDQEFVASRIISLIDNYLAEIGKPKGERLSKRRRINQQLEIVEHLTTWMATSSDNKKLFSASLPLYKRPKQLFL